MARKELRMKHFKILAGFLFFTAYAVTSTLFYAVLSLISVKFSESFAWGLSSKWAKGILRTGRVNIKTEGLENVDSNGKYIFISNHVSLLDIPVLFSVLPFRLNFLAKKELFSIPFFGWGLKAMGHISIDRSSARKARVSIIKAVNTIKNSVRSLVLFPEGTRSESGELNKFKSASFTLAKKAGIDIVPVYISGAEKVMPKKSLKVNPGNITLKIGRPLPVSSFSTLDKKDLSEKLWEEVKNLQYQQDSDG